ncbi:MAG: hypothetical protein NTW06_03690, partial [Candidatus Falkowbacteria bacterium]|nr:hypothetical protein [Candidatus Falkowbacteria bacterium]
MTVDTVLQVPAPSSYTFTNVIANHTISATFAPNISPPVLPFNNVHGFAWSANIGWISFNSNDCKNIANFYTGFPAGCPTAGYPYINYGVNISTSTANMGELSGFAWSENIGWISFNRWNTGDPPSHDFGAPPNGPIATTTDLHAPLIHILGWAKVLSLGDNGWIRFDDTDVGVIYKDVQIDSASDFAGWAWNSDLSEKNGVGWISFNSKDCDTNGNNYVDTGKCGGNDNITTPVYNYKVWVEFDFNSPPTVVAKDATINDKCKNVLSMNLPWDFSDPGDTQTAWYIQIRKAGGTWADVYDSTTWQSGLNGGQNYFNFISNIDYGTDYEFRVNVRDSHGAESGWSNT